VAEKNLVELKLHVERNEMHIQEYSCNFAVVRLIIMMVAKMMTMTVTTLMVSMVVTTMTMMVVVTMMVAWSADIIWPHPPIFLVSAQVPNRTLRICSLGALPFQRLLGFSRPLLAFQGLSRLFRAFSLFRASLIRCFTFMKASRPS